MENLFYHFSQVLGISIIHSMWQGLIVYMLLRMYLQAFTSASAAMRYKVAFAALLITSGWFTYTLVAEIGRYNWHPQTAYPQHMPFTVQGVVRELTAPDSRYSFAFAGYMPYITMLYLAGLVFNVLKMLLAWNNIYRIRQNSVAAGFEEQVNRLAAKLGLHKRVAVAFSEWVDVPCVTGFFKPIILLPFTIGNCLTADEIAAILLHEMAHIKRNDYLMNLIQQVAQILLFFNPFARLIGNVINHERENCCDDAVVKTTGTPLIYAQALLKLEETKQPQWHLALAATGKKYHLLNRIERIMKTKKNNVNIRPVLVALVLLTFSIASLAWINPKIENGRLTVKAVVNPLVGKIFADTTHKISKKKVVKAKWVKSKTATKNVKFATTYNVDLAEFNDPKLDALTVEVDKHAQAVSKYYESSEFKKLEKDMEEKGAKLDVYYNSEEGKRLQRILEEKSAALEKAHNNPELKNIEKQMEAYGKQIEKYYGGADFQKLNTRISSLGVQLGSLKYGTKAYDEKLAELTKLTKQMSQYTNNAEMQNLQKEMAEAGKKMSGYYNTDSYKELQTSLRAYGDSLHNKYNSPEWRSKQDELRRMGQTMADYQKRPEVKREMEALKQAQRKLEAYMSTPEFKQRAKEQGIDLKLRDNIRREVREMKERTEENEKPEAPEKPEVPEAKVQ